MSVCPARFVPRHLPVSQKQLLWLKTFLSKSRRLFVLTGAGVSTESGIQDYRSEEVWKVIGTKRAFHLCVNRPAMDLRSLVGHVEAVVPSARAESWDNVGLLVEPTGNPSISHVLLTTDLTEEVLEEAREVGAGLVVSYHPPIFHPIKRLTQNSVKERIIVRAIESCVAVYSPHTALDGMEGGVNDWLLAGLGEGRVQALSVVPLTPSPSKVVSLSGMQEDMIEGVTSAFPNAPVTYSPPYSSNPRLYDIQFPCTEEELASFLLHTNPAKMSQTPVAGAGRKLTLDQPVCLSELVSRVKAHLSLQHVRLAKPASWTDTHPVQTVAVCAGSGGTVLAGKQADLYLTGEMGHHDVLAATSCGTAVILCEHTNTERGFLSHYRSLIQAKTGPNVTISLANSDCEPLVVV